MKKMSNTTLGKLKNIGKYFVWGSVYNASLCKNDWLMTEPGTGHTADLYVHVKTFEYVLT